MLDDAVERVVVVGILVGDEVEYRHEPDMGSIHGYEPDGEDLPDVEIDLVAGFVMYCTVHQEE